MLALAFLTLVLNWASLSARLLYLLLLSLLVCFVYTIFLTQACYTVWKTWCSEIAAVANILDNNKMNV